MDPVYLQYAILHSMLNAPECVGEVMTRLTAEDFDQLATKGLFEAVSRLHLSGAPIDAVTVLREAGDAYLPALEEAAQYPAGDAVYYCGILREKMQLQRLRNLAQELEEAETMEAAEKAVDRINVLTTLRKKAEVVTAHDAAADFIRRMGSKQKPEYLSLGMRELDRMLYLELGDFILLGGYSSAGKTMLSLQFALALAEKYRVGYFTLETSPRKLTDRLIAHMAQVPLSAIKECRLEGEDARRASEAARRLDKLPLDLIPASGMTVRDIQAVTLNQRYQVIFTDYLQIISAQGKNRYEQVTNISMGLHTLAQAHGIAVFALAQLNRPEKTPSGKLQPPSLASFRESGQLEQDADVAMLLRASDPDDNRSNRIIKIAKNKDGDRDEKTLAFNGALQTFTIAPQDGKTVTAHYAAIGRKARQCRAPEPAGFQELPNDTTPLPF